MSAKPLVRLTREESQARTRQRLLDAARDQIVRRGVVSASIRTICEAAGYSQGAFYSNFPSKEAALLEVMEAHMRDEAAALARIAEAKQCQNIDGLLSAVGQWLKRAHGDKNWSMLAVELQLHALRDAAFTEAFQRSRKAYLADFARSLLSLFRRLGREPPFDAMRIAAGFDALWRGFALQGAEEEQGETDKVLLAFLRALLVGSSGI